MIPWMMDVIGEFQIIIKRDTQVQNIVTFIQYVISEREYVVG